LSQCNPRTPAYPDMGVVACNPPLTPSFVHTYEQAAVRKIKRNLNKRESRKRQIHAHKDRAPRKRQAVEVES